MLCKVIFHFIIICTTHAWLFFILPYVTKQKFNSTSPPVLFYAILCIYILLSAYQIRSGYPARISGNFLMKKFNSMHMIGFKVFMAIPFLFELRTLIDWTFTPTSLAFPEWVRVETIYAQVFQIKCKRQLNRKYERGIKKSWIAKTCVGAGMTLGIILILWMPMIFFAYTHSLGESTAPNKFSMEVRMANYEPLYKINVGIDSMKRLNSVDWRRFKKLYDQYPKSFSYLNDFNKDDVVLLKMNVNSSTTWMMSPPNQMEMIADLKTKTLNTIKFSYRFSQIGYLKDKEASIHYEHRLSYANRENLLNILQGNKNSSSSVAIKAILPKFIYVANTGKVNLIHELFIPHERKSIIFFLFF